MKGSRLGDSFGKSFNGLPIIFCTTLNFSDISPRTALTFCATSLYFFLVLRLLSLTRYGTLVWRLVGEIDVGSMAASVGLIMLVASFIG